MRIDKEKFLWIYINHVGQRMSERVFYVLSQTEPEIGNHLLTRKRTKFVISNIDDIPQAIKEVVHGK
jgi:hypothetical protein